MTSIPFVEILQESRGFRITSTATEWTLAIQFQLPVDDAGEIEVPNFDHPVEDNVNGPPNADQLSILEQTDDIKALELAFLFIPRGRWVPTIDGEEVFVILTDISVNQKTNYDWWVATATYSYDVNTGTGSTSQAALDDIALPFIRIGFTFGNRTKTITQSKELKSSATVTSAGPPRPAPNTGTAIGVTADSIEGTEVVAPGTTFTITAYYFPKAVTFAFMDALELSCGKVNSNFMFNRPPGEVLLLGADGSATINEVVPITFTFDIKRNLTAAPDPDFPAITMEGHDVLDYRYLKQNDADGGKQILQMPYARLIHRVYDKVNFAATLKFPM